MSNLSKLEPLDVSNYCRWSQKLLIFFEQLEVTILAAQPTATAAGSSFDSDKFEKGNHTICGHLLNHMNDSLFDLFISQNSVKVIWDTLDSRYGGDNEDRKKYMVGKWLQFQMSDDKPIMDQVHEYENLATNVLFEGMKMCEIL